MLIQTLQISIFYKLFCGKKYEKKLSTINGFIIDYPNPIL